jgi:arginyl-tRNA synthetase
MQIPKDILSEKNYEGSRYIEVKNEKVAELMKEIKKFQEEANPYLTVMDKYAKVLDPYYVKIQGLQEQISKIKEEMAEDKLKYDEELDKVQKIDQKAQMIKNKLTPIVMKEIEGQLSEFEIAVQTKEKNGKIFVEVQDKLEELIKSIRRQGVNKK